MEDSKAAVAPVTGGSKSDASNEPGADEDGNLINPGDATNRELSRIILEYLRGQLRKYFLCPQTIGILRPASPPNVQATGTTTNNGGKPTDAYMPEYILLIRRNTFSGTRYSVCRTARGEEANRAAIAIAALFVQRIRELLFTASVVGHAFVVHGFGPVVIFIGEDRYRKSRATPPYGYADNSRAGAMQAPYAAPCRGK